MPDGTRTLNRADELNAIGADFLRNGQLEPAKIHFMAALLADANHADGLQNLGSVMRMMGHKEVGLSLSRRAVTLTKNDPYKANNYGAGLLGVRRYDEAIKVLTAVIEKTPNKPFGWHNLALTLYQVGRLKEALRAFEKAQMLDPENKQIQSDKALTILSLGKIQDALSEYEIRWNHIFKNKVWGLNIAEWKGEPLVGRRILVHHEQGYGDTIMLSRFLRHKVFEGAEVALAVPETLMKLMKRSFPRVHVLDLDDPPSENTFDYHSPLLSVMRHIGIQKPADIDASPYLAADPNSAWHLPDAEYKVGLCWASGDHGPVINERRRVIKVTSFLPISEIPGVRLVSLQKGEPQKDILNEGMEPIIYDLMHRAQNFADTADLISHLDLVISVDSAVAHLAGALGKPVLMLSPFTRCWRWWNKTSGYPWYERMTIFMQSQNGAWTESVRDVTRRVRFSMAGQ